MIKNIKKTNFYLGGVESRNRGGNRSLISKISYSFKKFKN